MNKKGQNGTKSATAQEGDCGLESHQRHVGTTDTPVQPNLLNGHKPRLSDGVNNTFLKNDKSDKRTIYIVKMQFDVF